MDTSAGWGVWETWTKNPMKHFFKCLKNPSAFSRGIFQVLKKVAQGQQHLISQECTRMMTKSTKQNAWGWGKKAWGEAECFFATSECILLSGFCHHPSALHKDKGKKHKSKCIRMRQESMRWSRMLYFLIRMYFAECFCHHPSAYHKDDDKNHEANT